MALDISGNWEAGDDFRVLEALDMDNSVFLFEQLQLCMNQLSDDNPEAVLKVRDQLTRYEAAEAAKSAADLAAVESKTLIKADVVEWQVGGGAGQPSVATEMREAAKRIARYFAFCPYTPNASNFGASGETLLLRS